MTADQNGDPIRRLITQRLAIDELDRVHGLISNGVDVYMHLFDFPHEEHAPLIKSVSEWTPEATELTVVFSEAVLQPKTVTRGDKVTVFHLRPFNPA